MFKPGDKVIRTGPVDIDYGMHTGNIYTITWADQHIVRVADVGGSWDANNFEPADANEWETVDAANVEFLTANAARLGVEIRTITQWRQK